MDKKFSADFFSQFLEADPTCPSGLRWLTQSPIKSNSNPGKPAGCANSNGYYRVEIYGRYYPCHRIVLLLNGILPPHGCLEVDHIDRDQSNNKLSNLRWVNRSQNNKNKKVLGVVPYRYVQKRQSRYVARYRNPVTRDSVHVGTFDDPYRAHLAAVAHRLENHWIKP